MDFKLTISRNSRDVITVTIRDSMSRVNFVEVALTPENFALAITGLSEVDASGVVRGLDRVGLKKVSESRSVICPVDTYDRKTLEDWVIENCQEDGWIVDPSLRSQGSVTRKDEKTTLTYSVKKYVEPPLPA